MANYATLKAAIADVIKTNGNNAITGAILQSSLLSMIDILGAGYQFAGVATPETNPGTTDARVFYLAAEKGTYVNFSGEIVTGIAVLYYDSGWHITNIAPIDETPSFDSAALVQSGGTFNEINGGFQTDTKTWTGVQNQFINYPGISAGSRLIVQLRTTDNVSLSISAETPGGYVGIGVLDNENDIIAVTIPAVISNQTLAFTHGTSETVNATIDVYIVDNVQNLPYRIHRLFSDVSGLKTSVSDVQTIAQEAQETAENIDNKGFIKSYKQLNASTKKLVSPIVDLQLSVDKDFENDEIYIRILGVYQNNFFLDIWSRERGQRIIGIPEQSLSTTREYTNVQYVLENEFARLVVVLDWTKIDADMGFINDDQSVIILSLLVLLNLV